MQLIDRRQEPAPEVVREDARTAFRILKAGGVAVLPFTVSYAIFGTCSFDTFSANRWPSSHSRQRGG